MSKLTALTAIASIDAANDVLLITDVSDVTMDATGTSKKVTPNAMPISTAAQAALDLKAPLVSPSFTTPALGTPASGVATNLTGTAAGMTAGNVTTNANLTGHVTSVGNAAVLGAFTKAQLDTAVSDGNVVYVGDALNGEIGGSTPAAGTFLGVKDNSPTLGLGYGTGAGGAVAQITSRTTGVTLSKVTGAITLVSAAGSATAASFTVTNTAVAATDVIKVCQKSGTDKYVILVTAVGAGTFEITFYTTGGVTVETPVFNFAVIKGVIA